MMSELLEILLVAFCGLVLVFALLFIGCWCVVACAFYCLKRFYKKTVNLDSMVSAMTLTSASSSSDGNNSELGDEFGSDVESRVYASHSAQGYLESLETGSAAASMMMMRGASTTANNPVESHYQSLAGRMETGMSRNHHRLHHHHFHQGNDSLAMDLRKVKVASEDIPPQYETLSPPTYESLFPEEENQSMIMMAQHFVECVTINEISGSNNKEICDVPCSSNSSSSDNSGNNPGIR